MNTLKKLAAYMTPFQWFEVLGVIGFTIYFAVIDKESTIWYTIISSIAAIAGIFCVVLCAAGRRSQYYWGFANIIGYIIVSWMMKFYGEVMLNALYYLPTQFIGLYLWKKHAADGEADAVECRRLSLRSTVFLLLLSAAAIWGYRMLLAALGGNAAWLDSTSTTFSVIANALMVLRYREQWLLWIIVDAVTVVMWMGTGDGIMTAMWAFYLLNAVYGYVIWTRRAAAQERTVQE
jgi:nicotinamide mononucleotide transporter